MDRQEEEAHLAGVDRFQKNIRVAEDAVDFNYKMRCGEGWCLFEAEIGAKVRFVIFQQQL